MKKDDLNNLKESLSHAIISNKPKIVGALTALPFIAASTMQGACASSCPYGLVNDPYPGQCSRYVDIDGDGICDLSLAISTSDQTTITDTSSQDVDSSYSATGAHNGNSDISNDPSNASIIQDPGTGGVNTPPVDTHNYHILPISLLIMGGYIFTYILFKRGILKPQKHRRVWNLLLFAGYFGTGVTGILLTFMVNLGISTIYNPGITYWHAELSILMVVGTLVHLHLYKKPFKNMFRVLFGINSKRKDKRESIGFSK